MVTSLAHAGFIEGCAKGATWRQNRNILITSLLLQRETAFQRRNGVTKQDAYTDLDRQRATPSTVEYSR